MATPNISLATPSSYLRRVPSLFKKTLRLDGAFIGHYRVAPGEMRDKQHDEHHIVVPFAGSFYTERTMISGNHAGEWRTAEHTAIIPAGQKYSAYWYEEVEDLTVSLDQGFIARVAPDVIQTDRFEIVDSCDAKDPLIRQIAVALATEIASEMPSGQLYAESLVTTLAAHLLRHYSNVSSTFRLHLGGLPKHKLRRVTEFMQDNIERDLTLAELAQEVDLSLYHFARAFKQATGLTPIQFLMQRRIEYAKPLLADPDLPLAEVSLRAGFKNQSHFTTLFRKFTGLTPKAYRNGMIS